MAYTKGRKIVRNSLTINDAVMRTFLKACNRRLFGTREIPARSRAAIATSTRLSRTAVREFTQAQRARLEVMTLMKLAAAAGFELHLRPKRKKKRVRRRTRT